jgi:iron complex outermembrane recepter protein
MTHHPTSRLPERRHTSFLFRIAHAIVFIPSLTVAASLSAAETAPEAANPAKSAGAVVELEPYTVLGSRIRQTDIQGPSPVSLYDSEFIRSTGAFTLADFLNQLPQTYAGISSGRGSAPNELNPEFGQRTETTSPAFNLVLGSSAAPPAQTGVSGVSLRGLGSGSTLVLVDGRRVAQSGAGNRSSDTRQGFVDLNTIPLGMIERVEVITDGASALYGADAVAGVINIVLKKNYVGTEVSGTFRASEHGGGRERGTTVVQGFKFGRLSGTLSVDYFDRQNLKASERSFSREQNHSLIPVATLTATGATSTGRDYRLLWGYPAVVQASGGTVAGTFNAIPGIRVVAVPAGFRQTPAVGDFTRITTPASGTTVNASGQRRFNTAAFLDLIPESERMGFNGNFTYQFSDRLEVFGNFRTSKNFTISEAQLSASSITGGFGSAAVLPAAYNPFNQNVSIGMMLPEFGADRQNVRTLADAAFGGIRGKLGKTWEWDLGGNWQNQKTRQTTRNYNGGGFVALLTAADPAARFNPFIDAFAFDAPSQAALLETLAVYPYLGSESTLVGVELNANGSLFDFWGGPVRMAVGASQSNSKVKSTAVNYTTTLVVPTVTISDTNADQDTRAFYAELAVPFVGRKNAKSFAKRVDLQLAGRYEEVGSFSRSVPKIGLSWAPVDSLLVRGSWSEGFRAPGVTEYIVAAANQTLTLTDPRRTPASTTGVVVVRGSNANPKPERSENTFAGLVFEPKFAKGLKLQLDYYETLQTDVLQVISAQNIINNEAIFPERVIRATPDANDTSLNQPGRITQVNQTFINFGKVVNRSLDYSLDYTLPWESLGRWRASLSASHTLEATRQVAPGQPAVVLDEDTSAPPKWKYNATLNWRHGNWSASAFVWHVDGFTSNNAGNNLVANSSSITYYPTPAVTKLDLRATYEFKDGLWRGFGKRLRVGLGVNNVFDKEPPFSDTVWGFNAGLHSQLILGRAYELSFALPL